MKAIEELKYDFALMRIEELLKVVTDDTPIDDPSFLELEIMSEVVIAYEDIHYPIGKHSPRK